MALLIDTEHMEAIPPGIGTRLKTLRSAQVRELDEAVLTNPFSWLWIEVKKGMLQHAGIFHKDSGIVLRPQDKPAA